MDIIDVRTMIERFQLHEHLERAEAYFSVIDESSVICRKPWASIAEAPELAAGVSTMLGGLELFHGARVLDFGCGLGWLSRVLSDLGCRVYALDVSPSALALGQRLAQPRPSGSGAIDFIRFEGERIGLADGAVDRVACFDAFHHVPDQSVVLREMHRVLAPGGIAGFHEPGPRHSLTPQSQSEMRNFHVIENDIVIESIWEEAQRIGFADIRLAYQMKQPVLMGLEAFNALLEGRDPGAGARVVADINRQHENSRTFFLRKPGNRSLDSRSQTGLGHSLSVSNVAIVPGKDRVEFDLVARNTGAATWLPSAHAIGAVNLGAQLLDAVGGQVQRDYHRVHFIEQPVVPGGEVRARIGVPLPPGRDLTAYHLELDLVAEGIAWFANCGAAPARLPFP